MSIIITKASDSDFEAIWNIFKQVVATGDTYIYPPNTTKEQARLIWMHETTPYLVKDGEDVIATYVIRPNKTGLGSHVCNAGFMVEPKYQGKGYGNLIGTHALAEAKKLGYKAMQFNVVVSTNEKAVKLWQSIGFKIIGTVPQAFNHSQKGYVDIYIMHQFL